MNKTPEQLAKKWALDWHKDCDYPNPILEIRQEATKHIFLAGYQAAELKAKIEFAAKYDHKSPLQVIAAEYVKRRGTTGPLALLEENRFIDGYEAGLHASQPQWISVKDRLPEFGNLVLVFGVMEGALVPSVCIGMLSDNAENNYYDNTQPMKKWEAWERIGYDHMLLNNPKGITHWMPLLKPPEE